MITCSIYHYGTIMNINQIKTVLLVDDFKYYNLTNFKLLKLTSSL